MSVGAPMIRHLKEGAYERNIWQEHLCHLVNEEFIAILQRARETIRPSDYLSMMAQLIDSFETEYERCSAILQRYLKRQIPALKAWVKILS